MTALVICTAVVTHLIVGDWWFHYVIRRRPELSNHPVTYLVVIAFWPLGVLNHLLGRGPLD